MDQQLKDMLMQQAIVVNQEMEMTNVLIGIDKGNKYSLHAPNGQQVGSICRSIRWCWRFHFPAIIQQHAFSKCQNFCERWHRISRGTQAFQIHFSEISAVGAVKKSVEQSVFHGLDAIIRLVSWGSSNIYNLKQFISVEEFQI